MSDPTDDSGRTGEADFEARQHTTTPTRILRISETGTDCDLMPSFGASTAKDSGSRLGLHTSEKAVLLGTTAAVRLESTLRH